MSRPRTARLSLFLALLVAPVAEAQTFVDLDQTVTIDQDRGADPTVDYASLVFFGPWDDRNYELTRADLSLLAANEVEIREPLPAYFRVALRRARPELSRDSGARYPLHALNLFRKEAVGYLVEGLHHKRATRQDGRYYVDLASVMEPRSADDAGTGFVSGDVRVTSPEGASESAVAISPADTNKLVAGSIGPDEQVRMHYSADGGQTWTQTELPLGLTCCDPSVAWSADGQLAYATALAHCAFFRCELFFYRSDDGGMTWTDLEDDTPGDPRRSVSQNADREFLHVDQHASSPFKDSIYLTYHESNVLHFARSDDFGSGWIGLRFSSADEELGIAGDITTDSNGHIYFVWPAYNSRTIRLKKSTDGGASFGPSSVVAMTEAAYSYPIPAQEIRECRVYVSADSDLSNGPYGDSVYLAWSDTTAPVSGSAVTNHSRIQVAASRDGGATWTVTTPHSTDDVLEVDRWHPFLAVGPDGTVHVIFYDTRNTPDRSGVDIYYSFSTDGAETWSAPQRVTAETSPNIEDVFEYGDYIGLDIVMNDLIAIYTDNRSELAEPGDSVDIYASGIRPGGGAASAGSIYGSRGVPGTPLIVTKNVNGSDLDLTWEVACGDGTDYAIYEGLLSEPNSKSPIQCSTGGSTSATITPSPSDRFYLVVATVSEAEGSYGRTSADAQRTPNDGACLPQMIGSCP
ncbi:MAG: exo-alpha-sialidase [Acidobacteriota bacterium]|nr:MAG: exo-alpha-sialidase [Acidobacteriota bacterium]